MRQLMWIERLNLTRSPCISNWSEISKDIPFDEEFSAARCAVLEIGGLHLDLTCYPSCSETFLNFELSLSKVKKSKVFLDIHLPEFLEFRQESRKMGINDVLSLLGGGTSLFMGCSCVTLMETFIFLFKLVVQAFSRSNDDVTEKQRNEDVELGVTVEQTPLSETLLPVAAKTKRLSFVRRASIPLRSTGGRKVSIISKPFVRYHEPNLDNEVASISPAIAPKKPPRRLEYFKTPVPIIEEEPSSTYAMPFERIGRRSGLKRQAAVDIPDEEEVLIHRLPEVTVDDYSSDHFSQAKKFRRYSSVTSKCSSAGSGPHTIRIVRAADTKRKSQIFTKHMLMNDF